MMKSKELNDLKQKLEDTIGYYLHTFTRDGGWEKFEAIHKDDIPDLVEDILKLIAPTT